MVTHRWRDRLIVVALGIAVLRTGLAAHDQTVMLPVKNFSAVGIETELARPASAKWLSHLPAHIQIPNDQQRFVAAPVGGLVTAVLVGSGQQVKEGQTLARLVSPRLLELQRELAQAVAERERTRRALARDEQLLDEGLISVSRVEVSRSADRQAAASLTEKRALLALAGGRAGPAGELAVLSPMDGIVLAQTVRAGERVEPATKLFHVARLNPLELDIEVPLGAVSRIEVGAALRIPGHDASGAVIAIGRAVSDGQTLTVRARVEKGIARLSPGQHVEVEIEIRDEIGAGPLWLVPRSALVRLGQAGTQAAVFAQRGDDYVAVAAKPVGESGKDLVIEAQLHEGEPVVSGGASQLKAALAGLGRAE